MGGAGQGELFGVRTGLLTANPGTHPNLTNGQITEIKRIVRLCVTWTRSQRNMPSAFVF